MSHSSAGPTVAVPSRSQRSAIEAEPGPLLVRAGPGAGKTYCLTERIRFLIERHGFDPARICAFTFTNKAAGEIAHRLESRLGAAAERIKRGTIHAFCAELLREFGEQVGLERGFGIADEEYQRGVLRRLEGPRRWHGTTLTRFSAHRFRGDELFQDDVALFARYERFLAERKLVDFDQLVIKAAELLESTDAAAAVRSRWVVVLVDEFQDLNPVQYRVIVALAKEHRHVFAVGDDDQSIYSWAGADPAVFKSFLNDFDVLPIHLGENHRCPRDVFALARSLVNINTPIFADRVTPVADRESAFPVRAFGFGTDDDEVAWIVGDIRRDIEAHGHSPGDVALLYRIHEIGNRLEAACVNAGIPCRLAQGRALADDPVVKYVIAAVQVIASPGDDLYADAFLRAMLSRSLVDEVVAKADEGGIAFRAQLRRMSAQLPKGDDTGKQIRRAFADLRNLEALGRQQASLGSLVQELLSRRVGRLHSVLDERQDEISDPASSDAVRALAVRLRRARAHRMPVWVPPMGGADIAIQGMLAEIGVNAVRGESPPEVAERLDPGDTPALGVALGVFKAAQLMEISESDPAFTNFTAVDLETTGTNRDTAEIIEIAAVRVRNGLVAGTFESLVRPMGSVPAGATAVHGISDAELADQPGFGEVWPRFRAFCGDDVVVAHNGYHFDFPILSRMASELGDTFDLCTFDTLPLARDLFPTSRKLADLARQCGIDPGRSHRALDDTKALAQLVGRLGEMKLARARKTALMDLLGNLGVALSLGNTDTMTREGLLFRDFTRVFALGRWSGALEWYEQERGEDSSVPSLEEVIVRLGGRDFMDRVRATKSADERYPEAMTRLRRLIGGIPDGTLGEQLEAFLDRVALSTRSKEPEPERTRVNLLTLHSTKGLEFSRVYIVGTEDAQLPGGSQTRAPSVRDLEEARRLLYVGMTRTIDRLVMTCSAVRAGKVTGGHRFLDEMGLVPEAPP